MKIHDPGNYLVVDQLFAIVSRDSDGNEGVVSVPLRGTQMPLIAADEDRLEDIKKLAQKVKGQIDKDLVLIRLDNRTELETL